jgi:hypothetical protein
MTYSQCLLAEMKQENPGFFLVSTFYHHFIWLYRFIQKIICLLSSMFIAPSYYYCKSTLS